MIEAGSYFEPNEFQVWPALTIRAGKCEECNQVHAWQVSFEWLWYGVFANLFRG